MAFHTEISASINVGCYAMFFGHNAPYSVPLELLVICNVDIFVLGKFWYR